MKKKFQIKKKNQNQRNKLFNYKKNYLKYHYYKIKSKISISKFKIKNMKLNSLNYNIQMKKT